MLLFFLDPPYLFSNNSSYCPQNTDTDMTDIVIYIHEYLQTCKCKVMMIINDLKLLRWIFKDNVKTQYNRTYQLSKKNMDHLVITNF